jgi:hypothetical protein
LNRRSIFSEDFDFDSSQTRLTKAQRFRRIRRNIDDAISNERPAIDHDDGRLPPVAQICDLEMCAERIRAMRCDEAAIVRVMIE